MAIPTKKKPTHEAKAAEPVQVNVEKWGRTLIDAGWTLVPNTLIERQRKLSIDPLDFNIIVHLMSYWWEAENKPRPSKKTIADAVGRHPRTVQRRIEAMEKIGLIRREARQGVGKGSLTNRYHFDGLIKEAEPLARDALQERKEKRKKTAKMSNGLRVVK